MPLQAPTLFEIPAGWRASPSCSCGSPLWKVPHPNTGNVQPLTVRSGYRSVGLFAYGDDVVFVDGAREPTATTPGAGWNHFADCPDRAKFRHAGKSGKSMPTSTEQLPTVSKRGLLIVAQALESLSVGLTTREPGAAMELADWAHALRYGHHPSENRCDPATCDGPEAAHAEAEERRMFRVVSNAEMHARLRTMWEACAVDGRTGITGVEGAITLAFRLGVLNESEVDVWRRAIETCPYRSAKGQETHPISMAWCAYCGDRLSARSSSTENRVASPDDDFVLPEGFSL